MENHLFLIKCPPLNVTIFITHVRNLRNGYYANVFYSYQLYLGNTTVRGLSVDHWQICGNWEQNSTMLIDYYFSSK